MPLALLLLRRSLAPELTRPPQSSASIPLPGTNALLPLVSLALIAFEGFLVCLL